LPKELGIPQLKVLEKNHLKVSMNKSMCQWAWDSIAVRPDGTSIPCCKFSPKHYIKWAVDNPMGVDMRNSAEWQNIRQKMLQGELVSECTNCYKEEASGATSLRLMRDTKPRDTISSAPLKFLEMSFSNLCNLACVSCSKMCSSTWATEDFKHGRNLSGSFVEHGHPIEDLEDLSEVTELKIIGGEPFMEQKRFIKLMNKINFDKIECMYIATNGTKVPNEELSNLIERCKLVRLKVSLDGIGSINDWYRWPSKFNEVEAIMQQYQDMWGNHPNISLETHSVINLYNIYNLKNIIDYMHTKFPNWTMSFNWIDWPKWQSITLLPQAEKEKLTELFLQYAETTTPNWHLNLGNPFKITIDRMNDQSQSNLIEFKERTFALAKERNLDITAMVPLVNHLL
jgi:hypothetical protein